MDTLFSGGIEVYAQSAREPLPNTPFRLKSGEGQVEDVREIWEVRGCHMNPVRLAKTIGLKLLQMMLGQDPRKAYPPQAAPASPVVRNVPRNPLFLPWAATEARLRNGLRGR